MSSKHGDHCCTEMATHLANGEVAIVYMDKYRTYGIVYLDGGCSYQKIMFCPWCGSKLPESLRDEWFNRLEALGLEPEDELPDELKSDRWWKS